jgi:hypothetical protein
MERLGVPTVALAGEHMIGYVAAKYNGWDFLHGNGMPVRFVAWEFPFAGVIHATQIAAVNGLEPLTGKPVMEEITDMLTTPLTADEQVTGTPPAPTAEPRFLAADTEENLQKLFKANDWTDYQPIVLPTEERVQAMLAGTSHSPDEVVKTITWPAGSRPVTVEKVAIGAVMAGASPEHFPVILAASQGLPMGNSTTSFYNGMVIGGPIVKELNINSGDNVMGPYAEANAVIGRAFTILSKTVGGLHGPNSPTGKTTFSSLGSNLQYNQLVVGEAEDELPAGWLTLGEELGLTKADSYVMVGSGWSYISSAGELQLVWPPQDYMASYARSLAGGTMTVFMDPTVAKVLAVDYGFTSKEMLYEYWVQNVQVTAQAYWGNGVNPTFRDNLARSGIEPYATWKSYLTTDPQTLINPIQVATGCKIIVCGGGRQTTWFVTDFRVGKAYKISDWE